MGADTLSPRHDVSHPISPTMDPDAMRGRKRDRSMTRASVRSIRAEESSTLRGRSPRRASSPFNPASTNASRSTTPSLLSPTRHLLLHNRLQHNARRDARREHCPSRAAHASGPDSSSPRRQRSRSRSRGARRPLRLDSELHRPHDLLSRLRNEVRMDEEAHAPNQGP